MKKRRSTNGDLAELLAEIGMALGMGLTMMGMRQPQIAPKLDGSSLEIKELGQQFGLQKEQFSPQPVSSELLWTISKNYINLSEKPSSGIAPSYQIPKSHFDQFKPYAVFGENDNYVLPAVFSLEDKGENLELSTYLFSQLNPTPTSKSSSASNGDFYQISTTNDFVVNPTNIVDYSLMQREHPIVLTEQISSLYNIYFSEPYLVEEWEALISVFDNSIFRENALRAAGWIADAIAAGVIGNFVYERLKERFSEKRETIIDGRLEAWTMISTDCEILGKLFLEAKSQQRGIHIEEIRGRASISNSEKIRAWLKLFGAKHCHAGDGACTYKFE